MKIGLYYSGEKTIVAIKNKNKIIYRPILPNIVFQNPKLFRERFLGVLRSMFDLKSNTKIESMNFAINGYINSHKGEIEESFFLNRLTLENTYNGFNFKDCFADLCNRDNISVVNYINIIATTFANSLNSKLLPSLIIVIDDEVGVGLIDSKKFIANKDWGSNNLKNHKNNSINNLLGYEGLIDIIFSPEKNIVTSYTLLLKDAILNFLLESRTLKQNIKNVTILPNNTYLIDKKLLQTKFPKLNIRLFAPNELERIIIKSVLSYKQNEYDIFELLEMGNYDAIIDHDWKSVNTMQLITSSKNKKGLRLERIEYWANGELLYIFSDLQEIKDHWQKTRLIASGENIYILIFNKGESKILKRKDFDYFMHII